MNLAKFQKRRVQSFPLLLNDRRFGAAGDVHPGIDLVLNAVVIRRTKKQLTHRIENLLADLRPAQAIGEFAQKWFDVCDEADRLQRLPFDRSFDGRWIDINANGFYVVRQEGP